MQNKPSDWVGEEEARALADVRQRCGRDFQRIQSVTVASSDDAKLVFPVLSEWAQHGSAPMRAAVITCFDNKFARPHLDFLLDRWEVEDDRLTSEWLAQIIAKLVDNRRAFRALDIAGRKTDSSVCRVLAKLSRLRSTEELAKQAILAEFATGRLPHYRLVAFGRIKDPRITACYEAYLNDADRYVRAVAQRVLGKQAKIPKELVKIPLGPPRGRPIEVHSLEVDLDKVQPELEDIAARYRISIPHSLMTGEAMEVLQQDMWYKLAPSPSNYELWLRMEDFDIVELVVTTKGG